MPPTSSSRIEESVDERYCCLLKGCWPRPVGWGSVVRRVGSCQRTRSGEGDGSATTHPRTKLPEESLFAEATQHSTARFTHKTQNLLHAKRISITGSFRGFAPRFARREDEMCTVRTGPVYVMHKEPRRLALDGQRMTMAVTVPMDLCRAESCLVLGRRPARTARAARDKLAEIDATLQVAAKSLASENSTATQSYGGISIRTLIRSRSCGSFADSLQGTRPESRPVRIAV